VKAGGKVKQPYFISSRCSGQPLAMAGLWESWRAADGGIVRSCAVVTTAANALMTPIHDRMPVIIGADVWRIWLDAPAETVRPLLVPAAEQSLVAWPVSRRVSRTENDDVGLLEPLSD
jgi:putative SOS response-associated peptidase YedK